MGGAAPFELRIEPCPACGKQIENDPFYTSWCEHCGWNLTRPRRGPGPTLVEQLYRRLGRRYGRSLLEEVKALGVRRPSVGLAALGAFVVALFVYVVVLSFATLGLAMIFASGGGPLWIAIGLLLVGVAWVMRPRLPRLKEPGLTRVDLPALFRMLDRLAEALRSPKIDCVVITGDVNAGYGRFGWRQRRVLFLGLPLFAALSPAERVALLGHELGHGVNGDPGRGLFLRSAITSLLEGHAVLEPDSILPGPGEGMGGYISIPFRLVQLVMSRALLGLAFLQLPLCYRDGQRAEYYADAVAANLAGSAAVLGMFQRLFAANAAAAMTWVGNDPDPVATIAIKLQSTPPRELERLRRVEQIEGSRLDATHPPTFAREEVRTSEPVRRPTFVLSASDSSSIDRELERFRGLIGRSIVEDFLDSIS